MDTEQQKLFLKTIGRFVGAQVKPLQDEIAKLKARVSELEMTGIKFVGTYQRARNITEAMFATTRAECGLPHATHRQWKCRVNRCAGN
jgi:hypothetical protein